jgi:hypothetical protein
MATSLNRSAAAALVPQTAAALLVAKAEGGYRLPDAVLQERWGNDSAIQTLVRIATTEGRVLPITTKAAVSPAALTTTASLVATAMAAFIGSLAPASAAAALLARATMLSFGEAGAIMVPTLTATGAAASFVQEGAPIPVRQLDIDGPVLSPRKMAVIATFVRETFDASTPVIEEIVRMALSDAMALKLDGFLFDAIAGDATRPSGLRFNIAGLTPSALTVPQDALAEDVSALLTAVSTVAANGPVVLIASPAQAVALRLRARDLGIEVLASASLAAGTVVAVAVNGLVSATDPEPKIDVGDQGTLHMNDVPLPISTGAMASPTRSLWQSDTLSLRLRWQASWILRNPSAVAWMSGVLW